MRRVLVVPSVVLLSLAVLAWLIGDWFAKRARDSG